ncbi:MAG: DNA repair protein RadA, partial [Actinobacteria bacterium]|nr:DNA repair protein RadA [Actinomycetota bacterium]
VELATSEGTAVLLIGHVTKDGDVAGPRTLEHSVDVVVSFEGDPRSGLRTLACGKNRFGREGEVAWFEMGPSGLFEIDPSDRLAPGGAVAGAATALPLAGRRALAVEVQALIGSRDGPPRRQVTGLDGRRFSLVAAVLDRTAALSLARAELFGATAGGLGVDDPGADLAIAAALCSAARDRAPPRDSAFVGEIALTGQVRPVPGLEQRLAAAAARGIRTVFVPAGGGAVAARGLRILPVSMVREAIAWTARSARGASGEPVVEPVVEPAGEPAGEPAPEQG